MAGRRPRLDGLEISRRRLFGSVGVLGASGVLCVEGQAHAFGDVGGFHPRLLITGNKKPDERRREAPKTWAWELVRRTSAPARIVSSLVAADSPKLFTEPFCVWAGDAAVPALTNREVGGLRRFLKLGGMIVVDDAKPELGEFSTSVRRELRRVLPESPPVKLDKEHVIYKSYYILDRPAGRVAGSPHADAIVRGKNAQVILLSCDLLGALARKDDAWAFSVAPGGEQQRQYAVRFAVNLAMYLLCSDYKDDQVHAPWLMRRRSRRSD